MASCLTLNGYTLGCDKTSGGVKKIYFAEFDDVTAYAKSSAGLVTSITLASGAVFKNYAIQKEDSDWGEGFVGVRENRTIAWEQLLRLKFHKRSTTEVAEVKLMARLNGIAIVQNEDDNYFLLGADSGLQMTNTTAYASGINREDMNGFTIEMGAKEKEPAPQVQASVVAASI